MMQRGSRIALFSIALWLAASQFHLLGATLLFPMRDGNGNEINNPLKISVSPGYTSVGIGFKPHVLPDPGDPNSPFFPYTVPDPASLTVTDGGNIPITEVIVANASTVTLSGTGAIGGNVDFFDTSTFTMSGGTLGSHPSIGALFGHDTSKINISGGTIAGGLVAYDMSNVTMSGGQVNAVFADGGTINVTGGTVVSGYEANGGTLNVSIPSTYLFGGSGVTAFNSAQVNITGGGSLGYVQANSQSVVTLSGMTAYGTVGASAAVLNYNGGVIAGDVSAMNSATVTIATDNVTGQVLCDSSHVLIPNATVGFLKSSGTACLLEMDNGTVLGTIDSYDNSVLGVKQGVIGGVVTAHGESAIALGSGGAISLSSNIYTYDSAFVKVANAKMDQFVDAEGNSAVSLAGCKVAGGLVTNGFAQADVVGGTIGDVIVSNSSRCQLFGVNVTYALTVSNSSTAVLSGGDVSGSVTALNAATATISGGAVVEEDVQAHQQSTIIIAGGDIFGAISAFDTSHIVVNGKLLANVKPGGATPAASDGSKPSLAPAGDSFPLIYLYDNSSLEFDGHSLTSALLDPLNGGGAFSEYEISGRFADGTAIPAGLDLFVANGSTASFQLVEAVPEPASASLMAIAAFGLLAMRRNRLANRPVGSIMMLSIYVRRGVLPCESTPAFVKH